MQKKRMEILEAVIEEEIDSVISELTLLNEDDGGDYSDNYPSAPTSGFGGGYGGGGGGGGGDSTGSGPLKQGGFIGSVMGLDALRGAWATAKSTAAKLVVQGFSLLGTLVGGSVAAIIPFNDPAAINYVADKMRAFEGKTLKGIEEYYKKDMAQVEAGWEMFKKDFWGVGFFIAPFNMVTAAATTAKGAEAAATVLNIISAGKANAALESVSEFLMLNNINDPGSYRSYMENKKYERTKNKERAKQSPFRAPGTTDTDESDMEKAARRLKSLSTTERQRYFSGLSEKEKEEIKKYMGITESIGYIEDDIIIEGFIQKIFGKESKTEVPNELITSVGNWKKNKPDPSPAGPKIKKIEKIVGPEQMKEILKQVIAQTQVASDEQKFIDRYLPTFFQATMGPEYVQEINQLATKYPVDPTKLANMKKPETISKAIDDSIAAIVKKNKNVDPSKAKNAIEKSKAIVLQSLQAVNPPIKAAAPKAVAAVNPNPIAAQPAAVPAAVPVAVPVAAPTAPAAVTNTLAAPTAPAANVARR